jgi:DNA (cytosine-5)-methyltransferase 1
MIKVIELFAGVGGFRLGLEKNNTQIKQNFKIIWSNQFEPSTTSQAASEVYQNWFGSDNHSAQDITKVIKEHFDSIPEHDMLVGGFPCQDYSVARSSSSANGIKGIKGSLWWSIYEILERRSPKYVMLENVDSLLKSPSTMRGRDFAIILASLSDLGYAVEWRIINSAEYGMPQRRKRVFITAYKKGTSIYSKISKLNTSDDLFKWIASDGVLQEAFPMNFIDELFPNSKKIEGSLPDISDNKIGFNSKIKPFSNAGVMIDRIVFSQKGVPDEFKGKVVLLKDILQKEKVPEEFYLPAAEPQPSLLDKWKYLKGSKNLIKTSKTGYDYPYAEGPVTFPDALNRASRTIITGEGGKSASRFKHVIKDPITERLRRLTPYELEKLNMFPGNLTEMKGVSDGKRAFFMGNALVTGVVEKIAKSLIIKLD